MAKMWAGRTDGSTSRLADDFNSSISFDKRMFRQDIEGSMAHAAMLSYTGIIPENEAAQLIDGLQGILDDMESGKLQPDGSFEDIHMFVEQILTERIGEVGKKLHTARSRNDQVALDLRLYLRDETEEIVGKAKKLVEALVGQAKKYKSTIMPGYTHLQRAQPITFGHHLMAYCMMLLRDIDRLNDGLKRINVSPIGSCALAGTTYPIHRRYEAEKLGMNEICRNSIDGVSDRDFAVEFVSDTAMLMMHLSRLSEELVNFSCWEFGFVEISDEFTTGSSIMPQKKNPDMAELVRGKTGRVYGDLMALLTVLKGLPLAYDKDMQEDKESVFDAVDTVKMCLDVMTGMIETIKVNADKMLAAAQKGFINATDLADYLVEKGTPFRDAYKISGKIVSRCIKDGKTLETLPLDVYQEYGDAFNDGVYAAVDMQKCVLKRTSDGGTSPESVDAQIQYVELLLNNK